MPEFVLPSPTIPGRPLLDSHNAHKLGTGHVTTKHDPFAVISRKFHFCRLLLLSGIETQTRERGLMVAHVFPDDLGIFRMSSTSFINTHSGLTAVIFRSDKYKDRFSNAIQRGYPPTEDELAVFMLHNLGADIPPESIQTIDRGTTDDGWDASVRSDSTMVTVLTGHQQNENSPYLVDRHLLSPDLRQVSHLPFRSIPERYEVSGRSLQHLPGWSLSL